MFYGLDVHKDFLQVCARAEDGQARRDYRVGGHAEAIEAFGQSLARTHQVALEATFHSWAIVQILRRYVDRVVVADPAQLKAIANARIKADKVDAQILAQLLRMDFLLNRSLLRYPGSFLFTEKGFRCRRRPAAPAPPTRRSSSRRACTPTRSSSSRSRASTSSSRWASWRRSARSFVHPGQRAF